MRELMPSDAVLVTGAGGYVGRHVVTALADRGIPVIATVRPHSRSDVDPRAQVLAVDVLADDLDLGVFGAALPGTVIHLAWQDGFTHNAPSHLLNLSAHYRFLDRLVGSGVGRVAVLGTMHEVGYWEGAIDAQTPTNPLSLYGIAKDALRRAAFLSWADRTELQWLRCYYILGDDHHNRSVFTRILEAAERGDATFPFTTGANRYDFIDVAELGRQIAVVATAPGITGIVNCATGEPRSLREQAETFIAERGLDIRLELGAFPDRPYDSPGTWADATIIREVMARYA
jgi:dTDP-6-deoxy-L-talose 4-dehydrogenase (NAD+)